MGWNGSGTEKVRIENRGREFGKSSSSAFFCKGRVLLLGLLVVIGVGGAAWWILGRGQTPIAPQSDKSVQPSQIADVHQQAVTNMPVAKPKHRVKKTNEEQLKELQDKYGDNPPPGIAQVMYFLKHPPKKGIKLKGTTDYLKHSSERYIAEVALAEPGTRFFVEPSLDPRFDRDFEIARKTPIEINKDDSSAIAETKRSVEEVKQEIAALSAETGKKPSEIMYEHAKAMYKLGQYQLELDKQIEKIRNNPDFSDADYIDYVRAANEMLKNNGIKEKPLPNVTRRAFWLERTRRLENKRKEKEKNNK